MMSTNDRSKADHDGAIAMDRLREILDAYGASAEKWPAEERAPMLALLNSSARARALRDSACGVDRLLDTLTAPKPSEALAARINAMHPAAPRLRADNRRSWRSPVPRAVALAASVLIGVFIGFGVGNYDPDPVAERQTVQTLPSAETAVPQAEASVQGPPAPPSIAAPRNGSSGFGTAPLLAGSEAPPAEEAEAAEPVPLI
jgi:hypothetical protein